MSQLSGKSDQLKAGEQSLIRTELHIRPYPDPQTLQEYEQVKSGFADRLILMAEKEQNGRIELANRKENTVRWGMLFGLAAVLPIYAISAYAFYLGYATQGAAVILGTTIANLASVFVVKKNIFSPKEEKKEE